MQQKTKIQITQLVFNLESLEWRMDFHIGGGNTSVKLSSNEAHSFLHLIKESPLTTDEISTEIDKGNNVVYYLIN